jgi:hypothetical protein
MKMGNITSLWRYDAAAWLRAPIARTAIDRDPAFRPRGQLSLAGVSHGHCQDQDPVSYSGVSWRRTSTSQSDGATNPKQCKRQRRVLLPQPTLDSGETAMLFRLAFALVSIMALLVDPIDAVSQDMLRSVDLNSPEMSTPAMTRAEVEALLKAAPQDAAGQSSADCRESGCRTSISRASTSPPAIFAS